MKLLVAWLGWSALACCVPGVQAQAVYKCGAHSYSQAPCSRRVIQTDEAPVDPAPRRQGDVVAHRLPGETPSELALRKRRAHLAETDREECARLDRRIPFEEHRAAASVWQEDVDRAHGAVAESRKRFSQLRC
jgi:hypothetical protein